MFHDSLFHSSTTLINHIIIYLYHSLITFFIFPIFLFFHTHHTTWLQFLVSLLRTSLSRSKTSQLPSLSNVPHFFISLPNHYASVSTPSPTTTTAIPTTTTLLTADGIRCSTNSSPALSNNSIRI